MLDMDDLAEETQARLANQGTQGAELFGGLSESIFAAVAANMVELGWSIFPQETGGERRLPGKLHGRTIKWREDYDLANNLPDAKFLRDCILQCASLNVACVFGPASGNTFAVDIDVLDEDMVDVIIGLAEEILGSTPFMRVGRAPKVALIYRHAAGEENLVPSTSRHFANVDADGTVTRSGDGLEILGSTRLITFHGRHHKTGGYFKWIGSATPLLDGPEKAPLVSADQVQTFLEAVDARYRFHRGASFRASGVSIKWDEHAWKSVPKISLAAGGTPWVEDNEGLITDGREAFLTSLVFHMISALKGELDAALESQDNRVIKAFQDRALAGILASFQSGARMDGRGRWSERELPREAWGKVTRLIGKYASGNIKLFNVAANERRSQPFLTMPDPVVKTATSQAHVDAESNADLEQAKDNRVVGDVGDNPDREQEEQSDEIVQADPELSFLRANSKRSHTGDNALRGTIEPLPDGEDNLEIPQDRGPIADMVQRGLDAAFLDFFLDVYGDPLGFGPDRKARVHVLKAPTGAGKTTRCIRMLAADPRTYSEHTWRDPSNGHVVKGAMPWVMLLPTYANIDELRLRAKVLNLDGSMDDNGLRVAAEQAGLIGEDELDSRLAELRQDALNCGLRTMVYSGKLRAGCKMSEKVEMAMAAGIGTSAFCKATVRHKADNASRNDPGTMVEELCAYYDTCPAIAQRASIADMHLVFAPHSFLALSIPPELEMVRGVIADERVHHLFLHTATFAATTLGIQRKPPRLSARERQQGLVPDDLLAERDMAAHIALQAMRGLGDDTTRCPASALDNYRVEGMDPHEMSPGLSLVRSALRVCSSAIQRDGNLSPLTPIQEVREMCARPTGRELREEWQFWRIVEERIMQMRSDALLVETIQASQKEFSDFAAQWTTEQRLRHERSLSTMQTRKLNAHGARDYRIQFLTDPAINGGAQEIVRISWRTQPNWPGIPLLLLDASAAPAIVAKIWGLKETDIVVHDVVKDTGRALNVKIVGVVNQTFSNSSIAASAAATEWERQQAARNLAKVRQVISTVSAVYGHGRVVLGAPIVLRELVNRGWACPDSVDPCHFGALRGLDGFKFHSAALSIGRMEPPTRTIDGLVAALTYDDPEPEEPFDRRGDGMSPVTDAPLRLPMGDQRIRLRSGYMQPSRFPCSKVDGLA